jgi:hypothetical protein
MTVRLTMTAGSWGYCLRRALSRGRKRGIRGGMLVSVELISFMNQKMKMKMKNGRKATCKLEFDIVKELGVEGEGGILEEVVKVLVELV